MSLGRALAACATLLLGVGCGIDQFEDTIEDQATIPGTISASAPFQLGYSGGFSNIDLSKSRTFANQGVSPSDVDAIFVKSVRLEGTKMIDRVDIFESVELWVESPGIERKTIASTTSFPAGATAVDIPVVPNFNLKPYAVAPSMSVGATVKVKTQPVFNTTFKTIVTLLVDINLAGV